MSRRRGIVIFVSDPELLLMIVRHDNAISVVVDCAVKQQSIVYTITVYTGTEMFRQLLTRRQPNNCFASASFVYADLTSSNKDDEGVDVRATPIALASATTFNLPGLYSTWKLYSAKNESHLAILCDMCGDLIAVRNDAWSV
ncbi:hypothetical protein PR003_g21446 [Phytophthora rubi]|uniref:Uncharacterized protein n=1 Tax=Phytophthora rubi TaxID=129364 RepID=A0A6A3I716_9STRA|nr:hypothetical protein PR001_g25524 [Phytophthora rubi]KAE9305629.1 hypothetical protein PR003_g21446 [Phytophthora rubi]